MEVHAHAHTAPAAGGTGRKKWTHYLWEFLMLFLAVFCGFLAENQREHIVEHQREKQFMSSMIVDLGKDTQAINFGIIRLERSVKIIDTVVWLYATQKNPSSATIAQWGRLLENGIEGFFTIFTDRTSSQLKNSGSMRLIRNKEVADSLIEYWKYIDALEKTYDQAQIYKTETRNLRNKIFGATAGFYIQNNIDSTFLPDSTRILDSSPFLLGEYINSLISIGTQYHGSYSRRLKTLLHLSKNLIILIKKGYRL